MVQDLVVEFKVLLRSKILIILLLTYSLFPLLESTIRTNGESELDILVLFLGMEGPFVLHLTNLFNTQYASHVLTYLSKRAISELLLFQIKKIIILKIIIFLTSLISLPHIYFEYQMYAFFGGLLMIPVYLYVSIKFPRKFIYSSFGFLMKFDSVNFFLSFLIIPIAYLYSVLAYKTIKADLLEIDILYVFYWLLAGIYISIALFSLKKLPFLLHKNRFFISQKLSR